MNSTIISDRNSIGLSREDYKGSKSTLCIGCGHDSITANIISALYSSGIDPYDVAKMSGIGCSSKTPAYFMSRSSGFNTVHGRMPSASTGVKLANHKLQLIGISGDGDTASIGIGQFVHMIRRNLPIVYIVANNGVYGLTKGQFSATSEKGARLKNGDSNAFEQIDVCSLALELGCNFVARSFSGDTKHLVTLISTAMRFSGTAVIDIISPCVTFNNLPDSRKSYDYLKEHKVTLQELGFIDPMNEIKTNIQEGETQQIQLPDGSFLSIRKIDPGAHDVTDRSAAKKIVDDSKKTANILLGLFYLNDTELPLTDTLNLTTKPLFQINELSRPSAITLSKIMKEFK